LVDETGFVVYFYKSAVTLREGTVNYEALGRCCKPRMLISPEKLSELKSAVDIVEVISEYLPLKRAGKRHKALCPFHPDKDPSFYVHTERQNYRCFGCGAAGDVISFIQKMDNLTFPEAIRAIARRAGIEIEVDEPSGRTTAILKANEFACKFFEHVLKDRSEGEPARQYLKQRGIGRENAVQFRLGYAPPGWESLKEFASSKSMDQKALAEAGLLSESSRGTLIDFFRQRLIFPIFDTRSRVVAFGGRVLDDSLPKYINSPESPVFRKSATLYGLNFAKASMMAEKCAIVTEGYTDVMRAHEKGVDHVVATLGTAFTEDHARLLKRFAPKVLVVFDSDTAGKKAAERSLEILLTQDIEVLVTQLPGGQDLCDYLGTAGKEQFERLISEAVDFLEFKYATVSERCDLTTTRGRAAAADQLLSVLRCVRNPVLRGLEIRKVANLIGVGEAELRARIVPSAPRAVPEAPDSACSELRDMDLIDILLNRTDLAPRVMGAFPPESYADEDFRRIASLLYDSYADTGTISTNCIFDCDEADQLKGKMLEIARYGGEYGEKERDYEALFAAWVAKKEEELLASEIRKKSAESPAASLAEYFELKKKSRQKHKV
jgi:DNA primase